MSDYPYPGLRPFQRDEIDIFFGREPHVDQLIKRLGPTHFLAVVGLSGCGKSSLVRTGLWSDLETGFLASAGSRWQVAEFRPGYRPFASLAKALLKTDWGQHYLPQLTDRTEAAAFLQAQVRRVSLGMHGVLQETPLPADTNLLLIVDQFEEIFRYYQQGDADEAEAFVAMLLASSQPSPLFPEEKHRVYVVITMRSDFLGNCALFAGLSEAINEGQFLVPRLTREQLREAIEFPARVFGGEIEATVVNQLLNDAGTDFDQLPLLQHALMRMWKFASAENPEQIIVTLKHYDQIGGSANALSQHADKGYAKLNSDQQKIAEILFRSLCEYGSDNRDTRRPVKLAEVATLANVPWEQVAAVVEEFRKPWRSFLVPPVGKELEPDSVLDISHESLIRKWRRLKQWTQEEAESAKLYRRLEDSACRWQQKQAALWHSPDLEIAVAWREKNQPTAQWAKRYGQGFELAMRFLGESEEARQREQRQKEEDRQRLLKLKRVQQRTIWAVVGMIGAIMLAGWGLWQRSLVLQLEKDNRFESQLSQATLLVKSEDYLNAKRVLHETQQLDAEVFPSRRHARNLLARFTDIMGGTEEKVYEGPPDVKLKSVAISADGHLIAAAGSKGTVVLFDAQSGQLLQKLEGHDKDVLAVTFHPQGKWLASAGGDRRIILWTLPEGKKQLEWLSPEEQWGGDIWALAVKPDGTQLASGHKSGSIILWEAETGKQLRFFTQGDKDAIGEGGSLAFNPTGEWLASASHDYTAKLWDVQTGQPLRSFIGHLDMLNGLAISSDGKLLATGGSDKSIRVWNVESGQSYISNTNQRAPLFFGHRNTVFSLRFLAEGRQLVSSSFDRTLRLWDVDSGVTLRVLQGHAVAVGSITTYAGQIFSVSGGSTARRWGTTLPYQHLEDLPGKPRSVALAPDGKGVAVGFEDGTLRLYSLPEIKLLWERKAHNNKIHRLTFNREGTLLASASQDKTAKLWQVKEGKLQQTLEGHTGGVHGLAFSPAGDRLATASYDGRIGVFTVGTEQKYFYEVHGGTVYSVEFDPNDGNFLLSSDEKSNVQLWNLKNYPPTSFLQNFHTKNQPPLKWASFSTNGQQVATSGATVNIYTGRGEQVPPPQRLVGHEDTVWRVIFSPDNQQVATASNDATIRLWDLNNSNELFTLHLPTNSDWPISLFDFDFRCTSNGDCWIAVPLTRGKLALYELKQIYVD